MNVKYLFLTTTKVKDILLSCYINTLFSLFLPLQAEHIGQLQTFYINYLQEFDRQHATHYKQTVDKDYLQTLDIGIWILMIREQRSFTNIGHKFITNIKERLCTTIEYR